MIFEISKKNYKKPSFFFLDRGLNLMQQAPVVKSFKTKLREKKYQWRKSLESDKRPTPKVLH